MMGYQRIKSPEEILQRYWDEAEGEMTFDLIVEAMSEYGSQFNNDVEDIDNYELGLIDNPFQDD
jgi:3-oxoacyl-[acyl-carrier-protein] synthase III